MVAIHPIDYTTPVGQVRLLIADTNEDDPLFTDDQLNAFLTIEGAVVKLAAARALDAIAVSEVLVSKVIRTQDLATDGAKVAAALHAQADELREAVTAAVEASDDGFFFDVVTSPRPAPELTGWRLP